MILIIDNYDSFTYNLYQYLGELGVCSLVKRNDEISVDEIKDLEEMIKNHFKHTGSRKAGQLLDDWSTSVSHFIKVFPMEYRRVLGKMSKEDQSVERKEIVHR